MPSHLPVWSIVNTITSTHGPPIRSFDAKKLIVHVVRKAKGLFTVPTMCRKDIVEALIHLAV